MKDYRAAMLQSLVAIAWADETLHEKELEVIEALITAFELTEEDAEAARTWAKTPRSLDDVPLTELSTDDRRVLLQHAVLLSYADGDPAASELRLIDELVSRLHISQDEAAPLLAAAHGRARRLAGLRDSHA